MTAVSKQSTIIGAGKGLFADRCYKRGEHIVFYSGTYVDDRCLEGDRVLQISARVCIEGAGACRSPVNRGDLINHQPQRENCRFAYCNASPKRLKLVSIIATRDIRASEEFLIDYGPYFGFHETRP
jgi:hypothetical protein